MAQFGSTLKLVSPLDLQEGFARLSRGDCFRDTSLDAVLSELTESACRLTGVERASLWALNAARTEMRCWNRYDVSLHRHGGGDLLKAEQYPVYFEALAREEAIVADNAFAHPAMVEFLSEYLPRSRVSALLDTPIHIRGELQGVFRLEQVGFHHPWTSVHRLFAHAIANMVTLALVEFEATEARRQAKSANQHLRAVFKASQDALLLVNCSNGLMVDANPRAEALFGYQRIELVGKPHRLLHPQETQNDCMDAFMRCVEGEVHQPARMQMRHRDGTLLDLDVITEVAELAAGKQLALAIFRPRG